MTKRTKENLKVIIVLGILGILILLAAKTVWVGVNLALCSSDVIESSWNADSYPQIRAEADAVYNSVSVTRSRFYNSSDPYIRWLSNMSNDLIRVPISLIMIFSPVIFFYGVRQYNINKRRKRRRARI